MEWLNYRHLLYFWVVARQGSIAGASKQLKLAHPTISGQVHRLEQILDEKLFYHRGRSLILTEMGRVAFRYAEEIFGLGGELQAAMQSTKPGRSIGLVVGFSNVLPKSIMVGFLRPAFALEERLQITCREMRAGKTGLGEIALQAVDVVLSDSPAPPGSEPRVFNHLLGECGTSFFATPVLARTLRRSFPDSLDRAPFVMPGPNSALRRALEHWFDDRRLQPAITADIEDSSLLKVLGEAGIGVFAVPEVIEKDVRAHHDVALVGRAPELRQRFYAISTERKNKHPGVVAICAAARKQIFA